MKKIHKSRSLVLGFLERISSKLFEDFPAQLTHFIGSEHGVYALYKGNHLYYVGLATNLRGRIKHHLQDRHAGAWDAFSLYLVRKADHIKELESLLLRIADPKGNKTRGRLKHADNLKKSLQEMIENEQSKQLEIVLGNGGERIAKQKKRQKRKTRKLKADTIVVPAREDGFQKVFLGEDCWYAIRISRKMTERIKYIAAYRTAPVSAITHFARIKKTKKYKKTGKYIVYFAGKAREIGPIKLGSAFPPQAPLYTAMAKLREATTVKNIF